MTDLDFSLLPILVRGKLFMGLPHDVEERMKELSLPNAFDRLRGASWFFGQISAYREDWLNYAYLRAGLNEFQKIGQALRWDLGSEPHFTPERSQNPLVHLIFRLRNIAIYRRNVQTKEQIAAVTVRFLDEDRTYDVKVLVIENIESYLRQTNVDYYKSEDISGICQWFDENQKNFGASHLLDVGVILYCNELYDYYAHRRETT